MYNRILTNSHLPITTGTAFESPKPCRVSQLSPSQALTVNKGYSFSEEDQIRLGIPVTRHFDNGKTRPAKPPNVPTNPDRSRTYLVLRAHRMGQVSGWHRPWLPRRRRTSLRLDQRLEKHWPGGVKIKMTLESAKPKGKRLRWQMIKPRLGLLEEFYSKRTVKGFP